MKQNLLLTFFLFCVFNAFASDMTIGSNVTLQQFIGAGVVYTENNELGVKSLFFDISNLKECDEMYGVSASYFDPSGKITLPLPAVEVASHIYKVEITKETSLQSELLVLCEHEGFFGGYRVGL